MRNFTLSITAVLWFGKAAFSQSPDSTAPVKLKKEPRFVFSLHSGYAVALGSTFQFYPDNITNIAVDMPNGGTPSKQVTYRSQTKGLGEGFRYGAGISYILNDFLNVGIDFDYFKSSISRTRDSSMQSTQLMPNGVMGTNNFTEANTISYTAQLLTISPNITFKAISRPKFFIYNKIGGILVLKPNAIQHQTIKDSWLANWQGYSRDSTSSTASRYDWGIQNPAFGFMGALGGQYKLFERIRIFAEVQFTHVLYVIKNRVLTNYDVNGKEMINTLSLSEREVIFEKNLITNSSASSPNQPTATVTQRFPLTSVGLQAGLAYRF
jgi:hypothetical protein